MPEFVENHWNHGPHIQLSDSVIFITWRLAFTMPKYIRDMFNEIKLEKSEDNLHSLKKNSEFLYNRFMKFDDSLGKLSTGDINLNEEQIAEIIKSTLHIHDGIKYVLHCYCIMSNHLHFVIKPLKDKQDKIYKVSNIIQSIKRYTSMEINKSKNRTGQVWDDFYFDRIIRTEEEYRKVIGYILNNPVKAGLVQDLMQWRDSYFIEELL